MAFYIRKSINVGPLRFNLSQSGIGVSAGIKGLRIGSGPRGNYVHMGSGGLYYRRTLPPPKPRDVVTPANLPHQTSQTHGPMVEVASGCVSRMIDTSSAQLLHELDEKRRRMALWPLVGIAAGVSVLALFLAGLPYWLTVPAAILGVVAVVGAYFRDILKKSVVIMYDLDDSLCHSADSVHIALTTLSRCGATWRLAAQGNVHDPKYHAGAGKLIQRQQFSVAISEPPYVRTNVAVYCMSWGQRSLYFLPDRILVYENHRVGAIPYDELRFNVGTTQFIEEESVPRDAKIVDRTWRYVNKNGSPDKRFNNNRELPVCLYEVLSLQSASGLNEIFHLSQTGVSTTLEAAVNELATAIQAALIAESERQRIEEEQRKLIPEELPFSNQFETPAIVEKTPLIPPLMESSDLGMLHVLCCVMVADGTASRTERIYIHKQMRRFELNWEPARIDTEIDKFIANIRQFGGKQVLDQTIAQIPLIKRDGKAGMLVGSLNGLISADENVDERELILCSRLTKLLTRRTHSDVV